MYVYICYICIYTHTYSYILYRTLPRYSYYQYAKCISTPSFKHMQTCMNTSINVAIPIQTKDTRVYISFPNGIYTKTQTYM